jgi:hypothetical protein
MTHFKKAALSLAIASSIALVGCSGSSSSGGGDPVTMNPSTQSVSGTAVKGVLKNARVTIYELDDSGERIGEVGAATTNDDGEYEADLNDSYQGGLLEIEVTSVPGQTRMVCDASACGSVEKGQDFEVPDGFKLSAIAAKDEGSDKVSAPVTAWSTMATNRAKAKAATDGNIAAASKEANFKVQQVVGFDPSKVVAKDVNKLDGASSDEQQAAVMNAVVAEIVFSGGDSSTSSDDYIAKLDKFTRAIESDDSFGDADDGFRVADVAEATEKTLETVQVTDSTAVSKLQKQQTVFADPDNAEGVETPEYAADEVVDEGATQQKKIANFQKFVTDVRSWVSSIEALDSDELTAVIDADTVEAIFSDGPLASLKLSQEIINQSLEAVVLSAGQIPEYLESGDTLSVDLMDNDAVVGSADLTVSEVDGGLQVQAIGSVVGEAQTNFLPFDLTVSTNLPVTSFDFTPDAEQVMRLLVTSEVAVSGEVEDGSGGILGSLNNVVAKLELGKELIADPEAGYVTDAQVRSAFKGASLRGNVELNAATGESFKGTIEARLTRLDNNQFILNRTPVSVRKLGVSGTFTAAEGETFKASATLNINNASDFDTFAWVDYSKADRWYFESIDAGELVPALGDSVASVVAPDVSLWVENNGQGYMDIHGYYPTGDLTAFYPEFDLQRGHELARAVLDEVAADGAEIPMAVTDVSGGIREETISLQQALAGTIVEVSWDRAYSVQQDLQGTPWLNITVSGVDIGLAEGEFADLPNTDNGEGLTLSAGYQDGEFRLSLVGLPVNPTVQASLAGSYPVEDALWFSFNYGEFGNRGTFAAPSTISLYDQCVAGPESFFTLFGGGYAYYSDGEPASRACAYDTLSYQYMGDDLDASTVQELDGVVRAALAPRLNGLEDQVELVTYSIYAGEGYGYLDAMVKFPDLESDEQYIDASVSLSATARNIPDQPEAKVTATVNRTSRFGAQLVGTMSWDSGQYDIELSSDDLENPSEINGRFYDAYGRELQLTLSLDAERNITDLTGDAYINGDDIGDVTLRNGIPMLTYPNGDTTEFESLF